MSVSKKMKGARRRTGWTARHVVASSALALAACGSDEEQIDALGDSAVGQGTLQGAPQQEDPLYVIATSFITGDDLETYLVTTDTFDESTVIDPTAGPKLLGGIDLVVGGGAVFAPDSNGPVLIRYQVNESNQLVKGAELSFAGVGMTELRGGHVYVVNEIKGYVFDPAGPRIVVWNPQTMLLTGEQIDLGAISRPGWAPNLGLGLVNLGEVRRGQELLIPLNWQDQDGNSRYASGLLALDTETDQVLGVDEDERCGETFTSLAAPNGDIYFFPPAWSSTQHYYVDLHQPTCVLRVRPGEKAFDREYQLDLSARGSGGAATGAIPDGAGGFYFASVDQALWDARAEDLDSFWRMYHYDFASESSRELSALPVWKGHAHYVNMGGDIVFVYWEETEAGNRTTFYRANGASDPTRLFSYDASWFSFARVR